MDATDIALDDELLELLREEGIDPERVKARRAEMAKAVRSPEEEAKLAAERAELRDATLAYQDYYARNGSLADHARNHRRFSMTGMLNRPVFWLRRCRIARNHPAVILT